MDSIKNKMRGVSAQERLGMLKELIECCEYVDLNPLMTIIVNAKKRKSPFPRNYAKRLAKKVVPVFTQVIPESTTSPQFWWTSYKKNDIVSMDCEMVALHEKNTRKKHIVRAASVSVVDFTGTEIYSALIKHKKGSYIVTKDSIAINGFKEDSLMGGLPFDQVREKLISLLDGKLVVVCNGAADFKSLDICLGDMDSFDIQNIYQKWTGTYNKSGGKNYQPLSLKIIYRHHFNEEIQKAGQTHAAIEDARATMKIFRDAYIPWAKKLCVSERYFDAAGKFDNIQ